MPSQNWIRYLLGLFTLVLCACQEQVVQSTSSPSVSTTHCDSRITGESPFSQLSLSRHKVRDTNLKKIHLDPSTLLLPEDTNSKFDQFYPNLQIERNQGFSTFRVGTQPLAALLDHRCTLEMGTDARTKFRKAKLRISEALMTTEDEKLQDPRKRIRISSRSFSIPSQMNLKELSEWAETDPCVLAIGNEAEHRILAPPNDTNYASGLNQKTAYLDSIDFAAAYEKFFGSGATPISTNVTIAVIDSGVYITHEDLTDNVWVNTGETASDSLDNDSNTYVDDINGWNFKASIASPAPQTWVGYGGAEGHGTHVAGIIAAKGNNSLGVVGIIGNYGKIMGLNVFGSTPSASTTNIDNAIIYAANEGAKVINLSLGGETYSASTNTAITSATAAGVVVVAAAGNGDSNGYGLLLTSSYGIYPASLAKDINGMLSVGSNDAFSSARSVFSNCSTTYVEISAPGAYNSEDSVTGGIPSTWHTSTSTYAKQNDGFAIYGTSMSAPVVAGAAALALSLYATKHSGTFPSASSVETWLLSSGNVVNSLTTYVKDGKVLDLDALYDLVGAQ